MCGDRQTAEACDIVDDITCLAVQRIRRLRQSQRDDVPVAGADFDGVDAEYSGQVPGWFRLPGRIAMICQNDEVEAGASRRCRNLFDRAGAVRPTGVNVDGAAHACYGARRDAGDRGGAWRERDIPRSADTGHDRDRSDPTHEDETGRRRRASAVRGRACRFAWWTDPRDRASSE